MSRPAPLENMGSPSDFDSLPAVTENMFMEVLLKTEGHVMSWEERQAQLISFVWGNALENDRGTREKVCEHLNLEFG